MPHVIDTPAGLRGADKLARIPVKVDSARTSPPKPPWLRARDPGFDPAKFLDGARQAYETIVRGYASGDRSALQPLLAPESPAFAPPAGDPGPPAEVEIARAIPGRYDFTVKNHGPVVLRVAEKFDPNWQAQVDGKSVPVRRVDYMFMGIALDMAGTHRVEMAYRPSSLPILLQWIGIAAGLGSAGVLAWPRRRKAAAA